MQYLLTEEEYDSLNGDNSEVDKAVAEGIQDSIENLLKESDVKVTTDAANFGEKIIHIRIPIYGLPLEANIALKKLGVL